MNLSYLLPRIARHFMPASLARLMLRRKIFIRPGLETVDPNAAVDRYLTALKPKAFDIRGKRVLVFGYGGSFAVGCGLLKAGAGHVVLCDPYAPPDDARNRLLLPEHDRFLIKEKGKVLPRPEYITLLNTDIRQGAKQHIEPVDLVVSSSVFEHLGDVEGITAALAEITRPDGFGLHFIDLRDHFFRYPFEMLRYTNSVWKTWLNPTSNLNRYRLWDYRRVFRANYQQVDIAVVENDRAGFEQVSKVIRPEFISGNALENCATIIRVMTRGTRKS